MRWGVVGAGLLLGCSYASHAGDVPARRTQLEVTTVEDDEDRIYVDAELTAYVVESGRCLVEAAGVPSMSGRFVVLDEPELGAYALRRGHIAITRGLLAHLRSQAELEAVLAHEAAHIALGHLPEEGETRDEAGGGIATALVALVRAPGQAAHSRQQERDADRAAVTYLEACGRSGIAFAEALEVLEALEGHSPAGGFFSTHPSTRRRRRDALDAIGAAPRPRRGAQRERYLAAIDGLVYGEDPRRGYVSGRRYVSPMHRLRLQIPTAWRAEVADDGLFATSADDTTFVFVLPSPRPLPREDLLEILERAEMPHGSFEPVDIAGAHADLVTFAAAASEGAAIGGVVGSVRFGAARLFLLAVGPHEDWSWVWGKVYGMLSSLEMLGADAEVEPMRLRTVRLPEALALAEFADAYPSVIDVTQLATLNSVDVDAILPAHGVAKRVVGFNPQRHRALDLSESGDGGLRLAPRVDLSAR